MDSKVVIKTVVPLLAAVAVNKIFGTKTLVVLLSLIAILLFLIYRFQNKLLYIPGTIRDIQWCLTFLSHPRTTPKATVTPPSKESTHKTCK